ncbi:hypothetical protein DFH09DRAFT_1334984 [Mycena vulgaris]|nr:hypothetical protein DFH09DRAFT_1334984 [Mycena vulgaris]
MSAHCDGVPLLSFIFQTHETAASCTRYPWGPHPACPHNKFTRNIAHVDVSAQKRGCNPYPDLTQLPLQNYSHVILTGFQVEPNGTIISLDQPDGSKFVSDFKEAWHGNIKILLGLGVPHDTWAGFTKNSDAFVKQTNGYNGLIDGFDFLYEDPDAATSSPGGGPSVDFDSFLTEVRLKSALKNLTLSLSIGGQAKPDWNLLINSTLNFVNFFAVDFARPGDTAETSAFRSHSFIRDISAIVSQLGYAIGSNDLFLA